MDAATQTPEPATEHISTTGTLKRVGETLLSTFHNRIELLTLELKEEKYWAVSALITGGLVIAFSILTIVAVFVTVAFLTPEPARPWVLVGLCVACIGALLFTVLSLKKKLNRPPALNDTLNELKKDIACLKT